MLEMSDYFSSTSVATSNATNSRWLTEEVFKLIDLVKRDEAIYNPRHKYYFCRPYVESFWREVDQKLEKNPGACLAKWTNLRISFRREYTNYLEEKVPPCWSYFDRMFFLHPYLRKKHQPAKSLDSQVHDTLVQISSLSNRLQRERAAAQAAAVSLNSGTSEHGRSVSMETSVHPQNAEAYDSYLEYIDETEQNNESELDDMLDEEAAPSRYPAVETAHSPNNDIKSECEDAQDDYEAADDLRHDVEHDIEETEDADMRSFVLDTLEKRQLMQQQLRLDHLNRVQSRTYRSGDSARNLPRPRSEESISSTQNGTNNGNSQPLCSSTPAHTTSSNVSFVRPTFTKPLEMVSTTSAINNSHTINSAYTVEEPIASAASSSEIPPCNQYHHREPQSTTRHHSSHNHHHRLEVSTISSGSSITAANNTSNSSNTSVISTHSLVHANSSTLPSGTTVSNTSQPHIEICDCKTDPDAMFLMSLLPDIQKLNGRDRGKIKIAFQNILQDYLYPD